jgi:sirohydrochlorin ferrochelatase
MTADSAPVLVAVAHGTRDQAGLDEILRLVDLVRRVRPDVDVRLGWLELATPLLAGLLPPIAGPVVVVPLLLSTGYHVKTDITAVVAGRPHTAVAGQLGPDPRITAAVLDRLREAGPVPEAGVALFASGSSDPEAAENLAVAASQLEQQAGCPVYPRFLTDERWRDGLPSGVGVANYLLAPGFFNDRLAGLARAELGLDRVAGPLGAHPGVVAVLLERYDEAARTLRPDIDAGPPRQLG